MGGDEENENYIRYGGRSYEILAALSHGAHGIVYKVEDDTGNVFAIKSITLQNNELERRLSREIMVLYDLDHPNVVRFKHALFSNSEVHLVMEFVEFDLKRMIERQHFVDLGMLKQVLRLILSAVAYCHRSNVIHRDLKPANILIDDGDVEENELTVKVADFGMARIWDSLNINLSPKACTMVYGAPELLLGSSDYTPAVDLWSVGCILGEMVRGSPIFQPSGNCSYELVCDNIFGLMGTPNESTWPGFSSLQGYGEFTIHEYDPQPLNLQYAQLGEAGVDLLSCLLTMHPSKRISAEAALKHVFFSDS